MDASSFPGALVPVRPDAGVGDVRFVQPADGRPCAVQVSVTSELVSVVVVDNVSGNVSNIELQRSTVRARRADEGEYVRVILCGELLETHTWVFLLVQCTLGAVQMLEAKLQVADEADAAALPPRIDVATLSLDAPKLQLDALPHDLLLLVLGQLSYPDLFRFARCSSASASSAAPFVVDSWTVIAKIRRKVDYKRWDTRLPGNHYEYATFDQLAEAYEEAKKHPRMTVEERRRAALWGAPLVGPLPLAFDIRDFQVHTSTTSDGFKACFEITATNAVRYRGWLMIPMKYKESFYVLHPRRIVESFTEEGMMLDVAKRCIRKMISDGVHNHAFKQLARIVALRHSPEQFVTLARSWSKHNESACRAGENDHHVGWKDMSTVYPKLIIDIGGSLPQRAAWTNELLVELAKLVLRSPDKPFYSDERQIAYFSRLRRKFNNLPHIDFDKVRTLAMPPHDESNQHFWFHTTFGSTPGLHGFALPLRPPEDRSHIIAHLASLDAHWDSDAITNFFYILMGEVENSIACLNTDDGDGYEHPQRVRAKLEQCKKLEEFAVDVFHDWFEAVDYPFGLLVSHDQPPSYGGPEHGSPERVVAKWREAPRPYSLDDYAMMFKELFEGRHRWYNGMGEHHSPRSFLKDALARTAHLWVHRLLAEGPRRTSVCARIFVYDGGSAAPEVDLALGVRLGAAGGVESTIDVAKRIAATFGGPAAVPYKR